MGLRTRRANPCPTSRYGDPTALTDYEGGRSYDELKQFAEENLKPLCSPQNIEICDDEKKAQIEEYQGMDKAALRAAIAGKDAKLAKIERIYERETEKARRAADKAERKRDRKLAKVKDSAYKLMRSVEAMRNVTDEEARKKARGLTWEEKAELMEKEMDEEEEEDA